MKKMSVLIVGAGSIGQKEIKELQSHSHAVLAGIVEIDSKRLERVRKYSQHTFSDIAQAIQATNPDLVRIATPPQTHFELAQIALQLDKDVYLEKIMTISSDEAKKLVQLAKRKNKSLFVRRNAIYTAVYQEAWERVKEIGEIRHVHWIEPREEYSFWSKKKQTWLHDLPGGIISEHIPHALYTVRWFLGEEPDVEDVLYTEKELHVSLKSKTKTAQISYIQPSDVPMLLTIVGRKGTLIINHSSYRVFKAKGYEHASSPEMRTVLANIYDISGAIRNFGRLIGHFFIRELRIDPRSIYSKSDNYRQYVDIARGKTSGNFSIDGEEGYKNVVLFEKIWKKAGVIS